MASIGKKFNKLPKKKKAYLLIIISFFAFVLIFGVQTAYAYYNNSASMSILANLIGDFEMGDGDINMVIYKQNDQGEYVRTYAIPAIGYVFNDSNTKCSIPCSTDSTADCYYNFDSSNKVMSLTSIEKVNCKFYFDKEYDSDINVYVLMEDEDGTYEYNSKMYSLVEAVPAYGYKNVHSYCENGSTITYNSSKKIFNVSATQKEVCYGYFDSMGDSNLTVNVYVQYDEGNTAYKQVDIIPANKLYEISQNKTSACYDDLGVTSAVISYTDGYINIDNALTEQTCNVYLDIVEE